MRGLIQVPQDYRQRRIAILGASSVGKSSVTSRFVFDQFDHGYLPTIEDEHHKILKVDGKSYYLEILDTSGQDEYSQLGSHFIVGLHGYVMMFSVNDRNSFEIIKRVNDKLLVALAAGKTTIYPFLASASVLLCYVLVCSLVQVLISVVSCISLCCLVLESNEVRRILVGNKIDMPTERQVRTSEAQDFCAAQGIPYLECSAATGANVVDVFTKAVRTIESFERLPRRQSQERGEGFCVVQ